MSSTDRVAVAPRELHDLVYRRARIEGLDPGGAEAIATAAVWAESRGFEAAAAIGRLDAAGLSAVMAAHARLATAEARLRTLGRSSVNVEFEVPVPDAFLLLALAHAGARGVHRRASSATGAGVTGMILEPGPVEPLPEHPSDPLVLPASVFGELQVGAAGYLVAETELG